MLTRLQDFFSTPARQAGAWAALGVAGLAFAAAGLWLFLGGGGDGGSARAVADSTATSSATRTATLQATPTTGRTVTASPSATASVTSTPTVTTTPTPVRTQAPVQQEPTQAPTPEPTEQVSAGGPYCPSISGQSPPNSVFGTLVLAGAPAPAGTVVTLYFDGVAGPSRATTETGGYKVNWAAAGQDCANRVGAAISVAVNGAVYPSGQTVGGQGGSPIIVFNIED